MIEEGLTLYQEAGDKLGIAWSLGDLANVSDELGDHERAKQLYEEGIAMSRQLGGVHPLGEYLISSGYSLLLEGDLERATALNQEAADLFREQGRRSPLQYALDNLGWAALLHGDYKRAQALHQESLVICNELGDKRTPQRVWKDWRAPPGQ